MRTLSTRRPRQLPLSFAGVTVLFLVALPWQVTCTLAGLVPESEVIRGHSQSVRERGSNHGAQPATNLRR